MGSGVTHGAHGGGGSFGTYKVGGGGGGCGVVVGGGAVGVQADAGPEAVSCTPRTQASAQRSAAAADPIFPHESKGPSAWMPQTRPAAVKRLKIPRRWCCGHRRRRA